jgi:hypothetical protein
MLLGKGVKNEFVDVVELRRSLSPCGPAVATDNHICAPAGGTDLLENPG